MGQVQARAFYDWSNDAVSIIIRDGKNFAKPIEFEADSQPGFYQEPTLRMSFEYAQQLMDSLWNVGLRPVAGKQSEGVTSAQGAHLQDMRAIAFAKLGIASPTNKPE